MNLSDYLIIYLALGAPFGVYYFLLNRKTLKTEHLWLKSCLHFIFWLPFAVRLLRKSKVVVNSFDFIFGKRARADAKFAENIYSLKKRLEKAFLERSLNLSIYEAREIFDRYVGLTLECQYEQINSQTARTENGIFQITGHKNASLAAICLSRRNRNRLFFHLTGARRDFLTLLAKMFDSDSKNAELENSAIEFVTLLNDAEAKAVIEKMFERETQTAHTQSVKNTETGIWKSEEPKPLPTRQASTRLKAMTAATSLRAKD